MKILYVCGQINSPGGIQRVAIDKANYFCGLPDFEVGILTSPSRDAEPYFPIDSRVRVFVAPCTDQTENGTRLSLFRRISQIFKFRRFSREVIQDFRPDIIVHSGGYEIIYMWLLPGIKKWICEFHFSRGNQKWLPRRNRSAMVIRKIVSKIMDFLRTRADLFVVLTKEDMKDWLESGLNFKRIAQIYNSIDFPPLKKAPRKKRIIAVGRLDFQKRFEDLIEIWALLEKDFPEWEVDIYGEGKDRKKLEGKIEYHRLSRIFLRGNSTEIPNEMAASAIFVMTSGFEGQPMVLLEAMASALPCISFDFKCGPRDMISDGETGFIVGNRDFKIFAEKLAFLMSNEEIREKMGEAGNQMLKKKYSMENIMKQWEEIYRTL